MLRNLKIGSQIGVGFGLILLVMTLMVFYAVMGLETSHDSFKAYRNLARSSVLSGRVQANMLMASKAPKGKEKNWVQTLPGEGWWVYLRFYAPTKAYFDKIWSIGDFERVK
jgi:hypothetical protein